MLRTEKWEWKAKHWQIWCSGHIINLAVQAFLFADVIEMDKLELYDNNEQQGDIGDKEARKARFCLMGPLGKIHNIVVYI